jgi:hypothetical protein
MSLKLMFGCSIATLLALNVGVHSANAQSEVFGSGFVNYVKNGSPYWWTKFSHTAVNAWLDENGVAHGTVTWEGDTNRIPIGVDVDGNGQEMIVGGLAAPWFIEVTDIYFYGGNSAWVMGIVVSAPNPEEVGSGAVFFFTDNSGSGEPDQLNFNPIDAGNFTIW